jgi:E3 ubiquitin-protein ligase HUWE1
MEAVDPEFYKNLTWIVEHDITGVLELTFSTETDEFGKMKVVDLKPNGRNIPVTEENKQEYVQLLTEHRMTTAIRQQIDAFLKGFYELLPQTLISIFNENELELLICGLPDIDVADLKANTDYVGFTLESPVIQWFWRAVQMMGQEERALLLQFVTGTSKVPLEGFKALRGVSGPQKFQIHKAYNKNRLPTAHTCFNQLDLPEYDSFEELQKNLLLSIREGSEGFGFG